MTTFLDLKDRAQNMSLVEDDTLAGIFVNDVYRDLVVQGQLRCTNITVPISSTANMYTISDDFGIDDFGMLQYFVYRAAGQTQGYILDQTDIETALQLNSTIPTGYVRKYAFQGLDNVYLWPYPQNGTRFAGTNLYIHDNTARFDITGIGSNAVEIVLVTNVGPNLYAIDTSGPHGFASGDNVYIGIAHNDPGHQMTAAAPYTITVTAPNQFEITYTGPTSTGATAGAAGTTVYEGSLWGLGEPGFGVALLVLPSGVAYSYTDHAHNHNVTNDFWFYLNGSDVLIAYYAQTPPELVADLDEPTFVPTQWQHLISIGASARMTDAVGEDINLATNLQNKYEALYSTFVKWVRNRQGRGTQIMASGYSRAVGWPPHDRSAYYSSDSYGYR